MNVGNIHIRGDLEEYAAIVPHAGFTLTESHLKIG